METFGERLEALRKAKGYKRHQDLADKLEKKRQTIASWESGRTEPSFDDLSALADLLGCTIDYLVRGVEVQQNVTDSGLKSKLNYALDYIRKLEQKIKDMELEMSQVRLQMALLGKTEPKVKTAGVLPGVFALKSTPLPTVCPL